MKRIALMALAALVIAVGALTVYSTVNTSLGSSQVSINGRIYGQRWTMSWLSSLDTFTLPFRLAESHKLQPHPFKLNIATSSLNGDSLSLCVRLEWSDDNVNWVSSTLGTDSTTWATARVGSSYLLNTLVLLDTTYGGWQPYHRLRLYGKTTYNIAGGKARVTLIDN